MLQAQLLDEPDVVDAVPEGGQVRLVRCRGCRASRGRRDSARTSRLPVEPRFEDGFMVLLRRETEQRGRRDRGSIA